MLALAQPVATPEPETIDLQTARNAGVRICLARYGFGFADLRPDELRGDEWIADTPADIAGALHAGR